jgi:hypothetical protein
MLSPGLVWISLFLLVLFLLIVVGRIKFRYFLSYSAEEGFESPIQSRDFDGMPERLVGANAMSIETEKLIASDKIVPFNENDAKSYWGKMTSEKCFKSDLGEQLKPTRNFFQRTNNYMRTHPDDCSAPNHEFVGTFYKPHEGIGASLPPECGL